MKTMYDLSIEERKALYLDVIKNWGNLNGKAIAEKNGVKQGVISAACGKLRKLGIPLPKMWGGSWVTPEMLNDFKKAFAER